MNGLINILQYCYVFKLRSFDNGTYAIQQRPLARYQSTSTDCQLHPVSKAVHLTQFVGSEVKTPNQNSVSLHLNGRT